MCGILCLKSTDKISLTRFLNNLNKLQHRGNNSFGYSYNNDSGEHVSKMVKGLVRNYDGLEINNIFYIYIVGTNKATKLQYKELRNIIESHPKLK